MIGRNSLLVASLLLLNSCVFFDLFEDVDGIHSTGYLVNSTSDTIYVTHKTVFNSSGYVANDIILPNDTLLYGGGGLTATSDGDAIDAFFSETARSTYYVYIYDSAARVYVDKNITYDESKPFIPDTSSVLYQWDAPLQEMGDTIHHFYNRSSWEIVPTNKNRFYDVYFTIIEEDFGLSIE